MLGEIRMFFRENYPKLDRFWQSIESVKEYMQKSPGNSIVQRFLQSFWFHAQREDGSSTMIIWSPQINFYKFNDKDTNFFKILATYLQGNTSE